MDRAAAIPSEWPSAWPRQRKHPASSFSADCGVKVLGISAQRVVFKTVGMPWEDLAVARVIGEG